MIYLLINKDTLKYLTFNNKEELLSKSDDDVFKCGAIICQSIEEKDYKDQEHLIGHITTLVIRAGNRNKREKAKAKNNKEFKQHKYVCMKCNIVTTDPPFIYDENYAYCSSCSPYNLDPEGIVQFFANVIFPVHE